MTTYTCHLCHTTRIGNQQAWHAHYMRYHYVEPGPPTNPEAMTNVADTEGDT